MAFTDIELSHHFEPILSLPIVYRDLVLQLLEQHHSGDQHGRPTAGGTSRKWVTGVLCMPFSFAACTLYIRTIKPFRVLPRPLSHRTMMVARGFSKTTFKPPVKSKDKFIILYVKYHTSTQLWEP